MNQTEELRQAITDLFLTGTDDDHDEDELLDLLEEVDFDAVRQALVTESRRIFEFEVASQADDAMNYLAAISGVGDIRRGSPFDLECVDHH